MSQPAQGQTVDREPSPWTRPWFIASAAVIVLLLALGVLYAVLPSPGAAPAPGPSPAVTATSTAQAGQESVCGLPAGDQRFPSVDLSTKWELLGRVAVPTDPKGIGPGTADGNVRTCYQHSPTGALYAAANVAAAAFLPGGETIAVKDLSANGPRRDKFLASPSSAASPDQSLGVQIGGFQIQSYTGQTASVVIGLKTAKGGYGSVTLPLKWVGGDWKLDYDASGSITTVNDLSSFVQWSGA